jgi:hypothetical protein
MEAFVSVSQRLPNALKQCFSASTITLDAKHAKFIAA